MKKLFSFILVVAAVTAVAQPKKAPKMAPTLSPGYYLTLKGDTVKGEIQTNPDDETEFYHSFNFRAKGGGKVLPISSKKARSYGFDGKDFTIIPYENGEIYAQFIVRGRLNFMEYKMHEKIEGEDKVVSVYFIQDTKADDVEKELRDLKQISQKFYKRDLKPYMKLQPIIWSDMDKFTFNKEAVANSLREFNKYYDTSE